MAGRFIVVQEEDPEINMASMVDVAFLLLIYFIVSSNLHPREADLSLTMVGNGIGSKVKIDQMTITVNDLGHILVNDEVLDTNVDNRAVPMVVDRLSTYAESAKLTDSTPKVFIEANDAAKGQRFVDVLNALNHDTVGIQNVSFTGD